MNNAWRPTKRYMRAYAGLHGDEEFKLEEVKPKKKRQNIEEVEQIKFNIWFEKFLWVKDCRFWHTPNGGGRDAREGAKFKRMGVKAGVPDVVLPMARKSFYGLVIELKSPGGKLTESQSEWLEWFKRNNWTTKICYSCEEAQAFVMDYFS